jgi:hypothetical protein
MPGTQAEISNHNPLNHRFPPMPSRAIVQAPHSGHNNHTRSLLFAPMPQEHWWPDPGACASPCHFLRAYQYALVYSISSHNPVLSAPPGFLFLTGAMVWMKPNMVIYFSSDFPTLLELVHEPRNHKAAEVLVGIYLY